VKWRSRSQRTYFDLIRDGVEDRIFNISPDHFENIKKIFFYMKQKGNWSLQELQTLPIFLRDMYFKEFSEQLKRESKSGTPPP